MQGLKEECLQYRSEMSEPKHTRNMRIPIGVLPCAYTRMAIRVYAYTKYTRMRISIYEPAYCCSTQCLWKSDKKLTFRNYTISLNSLLTKMAKTYMTNGLILIRLICSQSDSAARRITVSCQDGI